MAVNLQKGQRISLSKEHEGLDELLIGLGWDAAEGFRGRILFSSKSIDCDAFAILLKDGKFKSRSDIIYYGNLVHVSQSVIHRGDNLTGVGEGDDEQITIVLSRVPKECDRILICVNIFQANERKQHFGMIRNAFMHIRDVKANVELCRYNLTNEYAKQTAVIFGELYRKNDEWKFSAIGQGVVANSIEEIAEKYR